MSTVVRPTTTDRSVVLHGIAWNQYVAILEALGDHSFHHTYDRGALEIMTPSWTHEWEKSMLGRMIEQMTFELDMEIKSLGSSTHNLELIDKGLEPDECFYIANEPLVRYRLDIDLETDPPPDLAVEIDYASSSIPRVPVYEALRVPELWRYSDGTMRFHTLNDQGKYESIDRSVAFPFLSPDKLQSYLDMRNTHSDLEIIKALLAWVREQQS